MFQKISNTISSFFESPIKVLLTCLIFSFVFLVVDGSLIRLWGLHRSQEVMEEEIERYAQKNRDLEKQLQLANRPEFVEKRARDRFDLVNKDEIIFVFPSN